MTVGLMNRMASLTILSGKTVTTNTTTTIATATPTTRSKILSAVVSRGGNYNTRPSQYSTSPSLSSFWMSQLPPPLLKANMNNNNSSSRSSIRVFLPHIISNSRCQSTKASTAVTKDMEDTNTSDGSSTVFDEQPPYDNNKHDTSFNGTIIATGPDGTQYAIPPKPLGHYVQRRHAPKIPPHMVQSRISKLRSISGTSTNIRHSPWRLNLVCQFAQGQTVEDALIQLKFVHKVKAPLIYNLIQGTANSAKTKYGLLPSQLEVVECFATQGTHLKRIKIMGRGRAGKMYRRFSHARVVLREIDFPLKIMQCTSLNQRNKWKSRMEVALEEQAEYRKEKEELEALEREAEEVRKKKEGEGEK